jgi:hypothetical protein
LNQEDGFFAHRLNKCPWQNRMFVWVEPEFTINIYFVGLPTSNQFSFFIPFLHVDPTYQLLPLPHYPPTWSPPPPDPHPPDSPLSWPHRRRPPPSRLPTGPTLMPPRQPSPLPRRPPSTASLARRGGHRGGVSPWGGAGRLRSGPIDIALHPDAKRPSYLCCRPVDLDVRRPGSTAASWA